MNLDWMAGGSEEFHSQGEGKEKNSYSRHKVFWDAINVIVAKRNTADVAIDHVYSVYGPNLLK